MNDQMAAALEQETRHFLELLGSLDMSGHAAMFTDDAQGVDEISRGWTRGRAALEAYLVQLEGTGDGYERPIAAQRLSCDHMG